MSQKLEKRQRLYCQTTKAGKAALWEMITRNEDHERVTLLTDKNGNPKTSIYVVRDAVEDNNGRIQQLLVPLNIGDYHVKVFKQIQDNIETFSLSVFKVRSIYTPSFNGSARSEAEATLLIRSKYFDPSDPESQEFELFDDICWNRTKDAVYTAIDKLYDNNLYFAELPPSERKMAESDDLNAEFV
jgi:hypothetical protein